VPLYVEQRLKDLAIGAGEPLLLSKQEVKEGDRKRVEWSVKRAPQQTPGSANGTEAVDSVIPETTPGLSRVGCGRENKLGAKNGEGTHGEHQSMTLVPDEGKLKGSDGMGGSVNGVVKIDIGRLSPAFPVTPPDMRVRIRRFGVPASVGNSRSFIAGARFRWYGSPCSGYASTARLPTTILPRFVSERHASAARRMLHPASLAMAAWAFPWMRPPATIRRLRSFSNWVEIAISPVPRRAVAALAPLFGRKICACQEISNPPWRQWQIS
jgi:hypothetical protein